VALRASIPVALLALALAAWGVAAVRRRAAVARIVERGHAAWGEARGEAAAAAALRAQAFARFDEDALEAGEELWQQALGRDDHAEAMREQVRATLDGALALAPADADARGLYADVTIASLERALRRGRAGEAATLRARLALYDDGLRAARLDAPAELRVTSRPEGARFTLFAYRHDPADHLVAEEIGPLADGETRSLRPGSYLITAELAGRYPTRMPFVLTPGEHRALVTPLPPAAAIPEGMVYVPGGSFHYGSDEEEATREFLEHQPGRTQELGPFLIARTVVTYDDYLAFLRSLPDDARRRSMPTFLAIDAEGRAAFTMRGQRLAEGEPFCLPQRACVPWGKLPLVEITYDEAVAYAAWVDATARLPGARLCTDREWERAARGADGRRYPHGDMRGLAPDDACTLLTFERDRKRAGPCLPGQFPASRSPFGVDDTVGNASQWTASLRDRASPGVVVARGGTWSTENGMGLAKRSYHARQERRAGVGLRLCADAPKD
jgi:formylglycine-generating enzyme required for sulfatase activity